MKMAGWFERMFLSIISGLKILSLLWIMLSLSLTSFLCANISQSSDLNNPFRQNSVCEGEWVNTSPSHTHYPLSAPPSSAYHQYEIFASRIAYNHTHPTISGDEFIRTACPAQRAAYTCHYAWDGDDMREHAFKLDHIRRYEPHNREQCQPFDPIRFLRLIRHRRVLMLGDSVTAQTWESLVCALYEKQTTSLSQSRRHTPEPSRERSRGNAVLHAKFSVTYDCTLRKCLHLPHQVGSGHRHNPKHAHVISGYYANEKYNTSLSFYFYSELEVGKLQELLDRYQMVLYPENEIKREKNLESETDRETDRESEKERDRERTFKGDIVIYNQGLFYNNITRYRLMLQTLREELIQLKQFQPLLHQQERGKRYPVHFFIPETTPQHFPTANGYFPKSKNYTGSCVPLKDRDSKRSDVIENDMQSSGDWRNHLLHEYLHSLTKQGLISFIPIAKGLRNQYDAHPMSGDCTHWCNPSAIFKYMHLLYFNAMLPHLARSKQDRDAIERATEDHVDVNDDATWRLHPTLRNGEIVRLSNGKAIYRIEQGKLHRFHNFQAFYEKSGGKTLEEVKVINVHEVGEMIHGDTLYASAAPSFPPSPLPTTSPTVAPTKRKLKPVTATASSVHALERHQKVPRSKVKKNGS
jgi:hypothetical protein